MFWYRLAVIAFVLTTATVAQAEDSANPEDFYRQQVLNDLQGRTETAPAPTPAPQKTSTKTAYDRPRAAAPQQDWDDIDYRPPQQKDSNKPQVIIERPQVIEGERPQPPVNTSTAEVEAPGPRPQWDFDLGLASGYSSNIAQFEGAPSGSFIDISPGIHWNGRLGKQLEIDVGADLFYRSFTDEEINDLFQTTVVNGTLSFTYWTRNNFFFGTGGNSTHFDGRQIDFTKPNEQGRDSRLSVNNFRAFFGRDWNNALVEFYAGQEYLRGQTTVLDEVGNQFFPDFNQSFVGLRVGKRFNDNLRWEGRYQFNYRQFMDMRARLANGLVDPNFDTAEKLTEMENQISTFLEYREMFVELGYDYVLDRQAGANTRDVYFARLATPFPITRWVTVKPEAGIRTSYYTNFIGNIALNPSATKERNDQETHYGVDMNLNFESVSPFVGYRHTALISNFKLLEFEEDLYIGGLQLQF